MHLFIHLSLLPFPSNPCVPHHLAQVRGPLIPGMMAVKAAAKAAGAYGCTISGAGPTAVAITDNPETAQKVNVSFRTSRLIAVYCEHCVQLKTASCWFSCMGYVSYWYMGYSNISSVCNILVFSFRCSKPCQRPSKQGATLTSILRRSSS